MRKLNLAALCYDRDGIFNALQRTNAVEIRVRAEDEGSAPVEGCEELSSYLSSLEAALEILASAAEKVAKDSKEKAARGSKEKADFKDGFSVTYEEFASAASLKDGVDALVERINSLTDKKNASIAEQARLVRAISAAKPYAAAKLPFNAYADTLHSVTRLGTVTAPAWDSLQKALDGIELVAYDDVKSEESVLVTVAAHRSVLSEVDSLLNEAGFTLCPYTGDVTGAGQLSALEAELSAAKARQQESEGALCELTPEIRNLKIYCDYIAFQIEKAEVGGRLGGTERTFFMEAYVPADDEQKVVDVLDKTEYPMWYEFSDPAEDDEVPTLLKNNAVVANFEAITNMYSPPSPHEFDPNTIMAFFYSLFLGFIMADIGYGILMFIGGGVLWFKAKKGTGLKNLSGVFAVGGIFTILWGFLFNSLFGIQILPVTVLPDAQSDMYSIQGINVPAVLVVAMLLGILHLCAGYFCKAIQSWRKGQIFDGIFDGLTWTLFSLGTAVAIAGFVEDFNLPNSNMWITVGGIIAGASLFIAAVTAGRREKFVGKFTKGFGSVYGIINYVSDILSYARLYGLMLSGAIIAQIVSKYSIQFITGGNVIFAVLGIVLMVVGHVFNLAIGLLGAYIHDARLQYVEFYGRFYTGEGELFAPLGSKHRHISLDN